MTACAPGWARPRPGDYDILVVTARAAKITVPLLAINGELDAPDHIAMAERLARTVTCGSTTIINGAAHYPNMEQPQACNTALTGFLSALTTRPRS